MQQTNTSTSGVIPINDIGMRHNDAYTDIGITKHRYTWVVVPMSVFTGIHRYKQVSRKYLCLPMSLFIGVTQIPVIPMSVFIVISVIPVIPMSVFA
jgi:hypothetical protein